MRWARPGEVADAVAVPVHERLDVEAVDDGVLPPQVAGVGDPHRLGVRRVTQLRQHVLAEGVEEVALLLADVVQVDLVEAEVDVLLQPGRRAGPRSAETQHGLATSSGGTCSAAASKASARVEVPAERRREDVAAPLVVGDRQRLVLGRRPRTGAPADAAGPRPPASR